MESSGHKLASKKRLRANAEAETSSPDGLPGRKEKKAMRQDEANASDNSRELLTLFTDCISALSTNKIGSKNAFEIGIIDHMNDLVNLADGSDDEEGVGDAVIFEGFDASKSKRLNFTRASKVVESASKIYGYRIEAVYDLTFNVLMNMNNANSQDNGPAGNSIGKSKYRGKHKAADYTSGSSTLAAESDVTLTEIPLDNVVLDPYFLKISSMFDQSGAQGLLLTNLQVSNDMALNLDGDTLVFSHEESRKQNSVVVHVSCDAIRESAGMKDTDITRLEIIPEVAYFRFELKKLQHQKKRLKEGITESDEQPEETEAHGVEGGVNTDTVMAIAAPLPEEFGSESATSIVDLGYYSSLAEVPRSNGDYSSESAALPESTVMSLTDAEVPQKGIQTGTSSTNNVKNPRIATRFLQRLAAIDLVGASEFSYYTTNLKDMTKGATTGIGRSAQHIMSPVNKNNNKQGKIKGSIYRNLESFMYCRSVVEELEKIEYLNGNNVGRSSQKRSRSGLVAQDSTTSIFRVNDTLTRLGTLSNRVLRISSEYDWRTKSMAANHTIPVLQIFYAQDREAAYSFIRINDNFSWKEEDLGDIAHDEGPGLMGVTNVEQDKVYIEDMGTGMDYRGDIAMSLADMEPTPMEQTMEAMYNATSPEPTWSVTRSEASVLRTDIVPGDKPEHKGIVPASIASYVDIFKIKKTLSSVILPTPEFQEALEDERSLRKAKQDKGNNEISCMFHQAITETVNKLTEKEASSLSSHIMFVCLLHVCNEQELLLRQNSALEDFHIVVDAPKKHHLGDYLKSVTS